MRKGNKTSLSVVYQGRNLLKHFVMIGSAVRRIVVSEWTISPYGDPSGSSRVYRSGAGARLWKPEQCDIMVINLISINFCFKSHFSVSFDKQRRSRKLLIEKHSKNKIHLILCALWNEMNSLVKNNICNLGEWLLSRHNSLIRSHAGTIFFFKC